MRRFPPLVVLESNPMMMVVIKTKALILEHWMEMMMMKRTVMTVM